MAEQATPDRLYVVWERFEQTVWTPISRALPLDEASEFAALSDGFTHILDADWDHVPETEDGRR